MVYTKANAFLKSRNSFYFTTQLREQYRNLSPEEKSHLMATAASKKVNIKSILRNLEKDTDSCFVLFTCNKNNGRSNLYFSKSMSNLQESFTQIFSKCKNLVTGLSDLARSEAVPVSAASVPNLNNVPVRKARELILTKATEVFNAATKKSTIPWSQIYKDEVEHTKKGPGYFVPSLKNGPNHMCKDMCNEILPNLQDLQFKTWEDNSNSSLVLPAPIVGQVEDQQQEVSIELQLQPEVSNSLPQSMPITTVDPNLSTSLPTNSSNNSITIDQHPTTTSCTSTIAKSHSKARQVKSRHRVSKRPIKSNGSDNNKVKRSSLQLNTLNQTNATIAVNSTLMANSGSLQDISQGGYQHTSNYVMQSGPFYNLPYISKPQNQFSNSPVTMPMVSICPPEAGIFQNGHIPVQPNFLPYNYCQLLPQSQIPQMQFELGLQSKSNHASSNQITLFKRANLIIPESDQELNHDDDEPDRNNLPLLQRMLEPNMPRNPGF